MGEFGVHHGNAMNRPLSVLKMGMFDQDDDGDLNLSDRFLSCLPYVLPLTDGDQFGRFIFMRIPPLKVWIRYLLGHSSNWITQSLSSASVYFWHWSFLVETHRCQGV